MKPLSAVVCLLLVATHWAAANPQGMTVARGTATASQNGSQLTVTASQNAFLNWQSFNIGQGQTTTFIEPSSHSVVWNQIGDHNPSQILGSLNANGYVVLMNQNGFYFGPNCSITVGGFVAASAAVLPPSSAGGSFWSYQGPAPDAKIINYGAINVQNGGSLFLIAEGIENHGLLSAPDGQMGLFAGKEVLLSDRPDGRGLSAKVRLPEGSIDNAGRIVADAGAIALEAQVVNQNGLIQANTVAQHAGTIELLAGQSVTLGASSVLSANGGSGIGEAGQVTIKSAGTFADSAGSLLDVRGGALGGNGGAVELSAFSMESILSTVDGRANSGGVGGRLLIDPNTITIGNTASGTIGPSGTVSSGDSPTALNLSVSSSFVGFSQIDLQALTSITVGSLASPVTWNLASSTGVSAPGCHLTLESGGNIALAGGSSIVAGPGWSVTLEAGRNFSSPGTITPGTGSISLGAGSSISSQDGSIALLAGRAIALSAGASARTASGGSLTLDALSSALTLSRGSSVQTGGGSLTLSGATLGLAGSSVSVLGNGALTISATAGNLTLDTGPTIQTHSGPITIDASGSITWKGAPLGSADGGDITLNALSGNINIGDTTTSSSLTWGLPDLNLGAAPSSLSLEAAQSILFVRGGAITAGSGWSLNLGAGVNFSIPSHPVQSGIGGVYLNGGAPDIHGNKPDYNGALQTDDGSISIAAGHEVLVGSGYIRTVGGGAVSIQAGDGNVDAGDLAYAYDYNRGGYVISAQGLGGIGTAAGGNVTINAGGNILAAASHIGAYGADPGNVSLTAQNIEGNFLVRNGVGTLLASQDVGAALTPDTFGLISGGWNINALRNAYINEVYNPNGSLNDNRLAFGAQVVYQFDYAPDAYAHIQAGNSVQLLGSALTSNSDNAGRPAIYPPILDVLAGAGGVLLGNNLVLYPSSLGSLNIQTADGGALASLPGKFCQLAVSDSSSPDYTTFLAGHSAVPLHLGGTGAGISLNVSGDMDNLLLRVPEAADITVHGNVANFAFDGQNLSPTDVTRFHIDGDYSNRSFTTSEDFSDTPALNILTDPLLSTDPILGARLTLGYDSKNHQSQLTLQNIMTPADLQFLLHPTVYEINPATGQRVMDSSGNYVIVPAVFTTDTGALQRLFTDSQNIPANTLSLGGLQLGGPGRFDISAHNLDLGTSQGIMSVGPLNNPALGHITTQGADISLNLSGNLEMTSSEIASFNGGSIGILSLGHIDVGSSAETGGSDIPRGIYTGHGGAVSVEAVGDINLDGSRIATYDGGNVSVISDTGTVDAGSGARGLFYVTFSAIDPATGQTVATSEKFFGSGIMATAAAGTDARVGDVTVQAGKDILANSGGIMQLAFNQANQAGATVSLNAGGNIEANNSGVLGANVTLHAGGSIQGLVVASQNVNIVAQQNVAVTVLAGGAANVSAGASISGSIVGGGNVSVSGSDITASVISTGGTASTSGNTSAAAVGAFANVAAPVATKSVDSADKSIAAQPDTQTDDEEKKKQKMAKSPQLMHRVSRVTVILPNN